MSDLKRYKVMQNGTNESSYSVDLVKQHQQTQIVNDMPRQERKGQRPPRILCWQHGFRRSKSLCWHGLVL